MYVQEGFKAVDITARNESSQNLLVEMLIAFILQKANKIPS